MVKVDGIVVYFKNGEKKIIDLVGDLYLLSGDIRLDCKNGEHFVFPLENVLYYVYQEE